MNYSLYFVLFAVAIVAIYFGESLGKKSASKGKDKKGGKPGHGKH